MKLSVFNPVLYSMDLEESLKYLKSIGVDCMEFGCGGSPGTAHASAVELSKDAKKLQRVKDLFEKYGVKIAALSVHGNGVHPNKKIADEATADFNAACEIAGKLGADRIVTFSGCPGDEKSLYPNWITCAWPTDYSELLEWQWNERLIPYWKKQAAVAKDAGVKVCFEMHPGFCVYNAETMMRLRNAVGDVLGANLDPSHLIWQGCDITDVIKYLGDAIYFFHAKDTAINKPVANVNGVLDFKSFNDIKNRSWIFRTVGYGNCDWKAIVSALRTVGYDYVMSIEHEDGLMTPKEGLEKAVKFLKDVMIFEENTTASWWA